MNDLRRHLVPYRDVLAEAADRVLRSGWFILGPETERFETLFADYCGVGNGIGVGNGTDALVLALKAAGVGPGIQVLAAANAGFYATTAILATGGEPLYVDIDPDTHTVTEDAVQDGLNRATRPGAVIVTHLFGRAVADIKEISALAEARGISLIEDCAQAHGARIKGRRVGSWGRFGCFSFYPTKNLGALGDGGMVVTGDAGLAARLRKLRQYGWSAKYRVALAGGMNSRLDEMQAALLGTLLPELDGWNQRRRDVVAAYRRKLGGVDGLWLPPLGIEASEEDTTYHLFVLRSPQRDALQVHLSALGISTDIHYPTPDHKQAAIAAEPWAKAALPETERSAAEILSIPCSPEITEAEIDAVCAGLASFGRAD
tara:strand:+ start:59667 stop:60785 length:1119 start_codon:yes stop_codon:yes gene_type:complete